MTLQELSNEYRQSGEAVRHRARELEIELSDRALTETQRLALRRRLSILNAMARETIATARYLQRYYQKEEEK